MKHTDSKQQSPDTKNSAEVLPEKLDVHSTGLFPMKAEIHPVNDPRGLIILADVQTMELAEELVSRYNNFPSLKEDVRELLEVLKDAETRLEMLSEADCFDKKDKKCLDNISALLYTIKNKHTKS